MKQPSLFILHSSLLAESLVISGFEHHPVAAFIRVPIAQNVDFCLTPLVNPA
jgi:hypothetical protein